MLGDLASVYVELGEERSVEDGSNGLVALSVHGLWVVQQFKCPVKDRSPGIKALFGLVEFVPDVFALLPDGLDFLAKFVFRLALFGRKIEKVAFLGIEFV